MSQVLPDSLTHAYAKCENRHLCSINDNFFSKTKTFCFISQNPLDKLRYSLVFTKSRVFLWVANFQGLTSSFARLPILSRNFIAGYICLTKNTGFFTRGGIYPFLLYPTHVFFISFFFYAIVRLILDIVPFYQAYHRTPNDLPCTHDIPSNTKHIVDLPCTQDKPSNTKHSVDLYHVLTKYHRTPNTVSISTMHSHPCHVMFRA